MEAEGKKRLEETLPELHFAVDRKDTTSAERDRAIAQQIATLQVGGSEIVFAQQREQAGVHEKRNIDPFRYSFSPFESRDVEKTISASPCPN